MSRKRKSSKRREKARAAKRAAKQREVKIEREAVDSLESDEVSAVHAAEDSRTSVSDASTEPDVSTARGGDGRGLGLGDVDVKVVLGAVPSGSADDGVMPSSPQTFADTEATDEVLEDASVTQGPDLPMSPSKPVHFSFDDGTGGAQADDDETTLPFAVVDGDAEVSQALLEMSVEESQEGEPTPKIGTSESTLDVSSTSHHDAVLVQGDDASQTEANTEEEHVDTAQVIAREEMSGTTHEPDTAQGSYTGSDEVSEADDPGDAGEAVDVEAAPSVGESGTELIAAQSSAKEDAEATDEAVVKEAAAEEERASAETIDELSKMAAPTPESVESGVSDVELSTGSDTEIAASSDTEEIEDRITQETAFDASSAELDEHIIAIPQELAAPEDRAVSSGDDAVEDDLDDDGLDTFNDLVLPDFSQNPDFVDVHVERAIADTLDEVGAGYKVSLSTPLETMDTLEIPSFDVLDSVAEQAETEVGTDPEVVIEAGFDARSTLPDVPLDTFTTQEMPSYDELGSSPTHPTPTAAEPEEVAKSKKRQHSRDERDTQRFSSMSTMSSPSAFFLVEEPGVSLWTDAWRRWRKNKMAVFGALFLLFLIAAALFGPWLLPFQYGDQNLKAAYQAPSTIHWMGTDSLGRDLLARLLMGARISLGVGLVATLVSLLIGLVYGAIAGYLGGWVDDVMMRFVDLLYGLPYMFLVIIVMAVIPDLLGQRNGQAISPYQSFLVIFVVLGAFQWLTMARIVRGQVLSLKQKEFVEAAEACGARRSRILFVHIVPNLLGPVIVYATLTVPQVILQEAFLSFIGLGIQAPLASWGTLAAEAMQNMNPLHSHWWLVMFPGLFLALTLFSLNFVGDGLRDALDPQTRGRQA